MNNFHPFSLVPSSLWTRGLLLGSLLLLLTFLIGCGSDDDGPRQLPEHDFELRVETTTEDGTPVPGVGVKLDDEIIAYTDSEGIFQGNLREQPTQQIRLAITDIDGYRIVDDESATEETLQLVERLDGDGYRGVPVRLRVELESMLRQHLAWVSIDCDDDLDDRYCVDVPVELDGEIMGRTNSSGVTHFPFESSPGTSHTVTIPVTVNDDDIDVEPMSPRYEFDVGIDSSVFFIDEEFTDPDAGSSWTPPPRPSPSPPSSSPSPSADEEPDDDDGEEENGDDIIRLFD